MQQSCTWQARKLPSQCVMKTPQPAGSLAKYELLQFTERMSSTDFTGVLRLRLGRDEVRIYVVEGQARFCMGTGGHHSFAAHLIRTKQFTKAALKGYAEQAEAESVRLEDVLVRAGILERKKVLQMQAALSHFVFGDACCAGPSTCRMEEGKVPPIVNKLNLYPVRAFGAYINQWDRTEHGAALKDCVELEILKTSAWDAIGDRFKFVFPQQFGALIRALEEGTTLAKQGMDSLKLIYALRAAGVIKFKGEPVRKKSKPRTARKPAEKPSPVADVAPQEAPEPKAAPAPEAAP